MTVHRRARPGIAKISLFGIAAAVILVGIAGWANTNANSNNFPLEVQGPQIDPFQIMLTAKNLPSQESLTLKMWPDNGVVRY
jgi:hypothetical protein